MKFPVIATRGVIAFPKHTSLIDVGRKVSLNAIDLASLQSNSKLILVSQKNIMQENPTSSKDLFSYGTLVMVKVEKESPSGAKTISALGLERVKISSFSFRNKQLIEAEVSILKSKVNDGIKEQAFVKTISSQLDEVLSGMINVPKSVLTSLATGISAAEISDVIGHYLPLNLEKKQKLLQTTVVEKRLELVTKYLKEENDINKIDKDIDKSVRKVLDSQQKEFLLREKMKAIKEELGDISNKDSEIDNWKEMLKDKKYPTAIREKAFEEIKKFEAMPPISAEAHVSRGYIEWLVKLPWKTYSADASSLQQAKKTLNKYHYALDKVKERIIEYLAVKINTKNTTSPIITLVGPPGVGKTSLAKSIGEAVGREVVKVSLGGLRDEAEIRGHRRTYVGAMPGKIIQAINKAKTSNPVILLDEIDKMASDYKGDPTSAMLEVLDPEQNKNFQDHYLEVEYDLSQVMFIATANFYDQIPGPLLDRVEIIYLDQYTSEEKLAIAKTHIIPVVLHENGLNKGQFKISDKVLAYIIDKYTLEAGVRGLQRVLDKLARKIVVQKLHKKVKSSYTLSIEKVKNFLGREKVSKEPLEGKAEMGYATGMYYSAVGGGILPIEVTTFPSKNGGIKLTGSIKEVMKESMDVAIGYIRANAKKFNIKFDFEENAIQVHVPEGAIPKDGPSAGVAFTTAIASALLHKTVSKDVAMTGEITLRGKILEIGGLKQKTLGAVEAGVRTILIPKVNTKDLEELPAKVKKMAKIVPVSTYDEVFTIMFK